MISSWLLYMYLCFTSLWYLPDYCTCTFASQVYHIFLNIVDVLLLHQSMILSWILYMYFCFTSLWYLPDYCTCTFASPVYDIFLIIVHVLLLHQSMISSWLLYMYLCFTSLISSRLLYIYLFFSLCYLPDYCTCAFASPVYDIFLIIVHLPLLHQFMIYSWLLYIYLCFISLWYIPYYCTFTFASSVYNIFRFIVHVPLLHQSIIYHYYYTCTFAFLVSWLLYLYICCTCLYLFIAPQKPLNVTGVATSDPEILQVTWQQPLPRPGITTYKVKVYEENDQKTMFVYKEGFKKEISGIII
jgi:hypothetical protein